MCFDKTGTLTEDTIDFAGFLHWEYGALEQLFTSVKTIPSDDILVKTMATCHSLIKYNDNTEGDDLDLKLFAHSSYKLVDKFSVDNWFEKEPERIVVNGHNHVVAIYKQFPFESFLQRMLVIVKDVESNTFLAIVKGAPEMIVSFCDPSTIPDNFSKTLDSYTQKGFRVIASAYKVLDCDFQTCLDMTRADIECKMNFTGLFLFKNKLKPITTKILEELAGANIRCIMSTGDNLLTGISVAQECNMIQPGEAIIRVNACKDEHGEAGIHVRFSYIQRPNFELINETNNNTSLEQVENIGSSKFQFHLVIDGNTFNLIRSKAPQVLEKIIQRTTVFARMSSDHKLALVKLLQKQDHRVGMCGDGANDCGALRAADAGISLSVAEASVASSFTYKNKDISCVPMLIKEGRCTLTAVFGAFQYQVCYCFILLGAVLILFWHGAKPGDGNIVANLS